MKKYMILGATGLLGSRLKKNIESCEGTFYKSPTGETAKMHFLNATEIDKFQTLIKQVRPDIIINCIGLANVDVCESYPEKNWLLNCEVPRKLAHECKQKGIKFIHISTDHFLNPMGAKLSESMPLAYINQYSFAKLAAEKAILSLNADAIVVRTNFFHFNLTDPQTFLDNMIKSYSKPTKFHSFYDVIFTPISTYFLLQYILELVSLQFSGLINICSSEPISKFNFHQAVLVSLGYDLYNHYPIALQNEDSRAVRPKYMALSNDKLQSLISSKVVSIYDMIKYEVQNSE